MKIKVKLRRHILIGRYFRFKDVVGSRITWKYTEIRGENIYYRFLIDGSGRPCKTTSASYYGNELERLRDYKEITDELELQNLYEIERNT